MASNISYTITRSNNKTEKIGIDYLIENDHCIWRVDKNIRRMLMQTFKIDKKYSRAFDLIRVEDSNNSEKLAIGNDTKITFIELKTTQKYLKDFPRGFFFGATENEFEIARELGEQYKFCFVSLHENSKQYCLMTLKELESIIKTKRIQYQINI